jgi:hypothetical protein
MTRTDLVHFEVTKNKEHDMAGAIGWVLLLVGLGLLWQVALAMHRDKSEGMRRIKLVLAVLLAGALGALLVALGGIALLAGVIVAMVAVAWVVQGFRK